MSNRKKDIVRVLAFDPALSNTGWSVIDYNMRTGEKTIIKTGCIKPGQKAGLVAHRDEVNYYDKNTVSLRLLREMVREIYAQYQPQHIVVEDAFFNPKRPNAYASLLGWIVTIKMLARDEFDKPIYRVPTRKAKQELTGSGGNGKVTVKQSILDNDKITFRGKKQAELMSDHESDSIAVGYFFCNCILSTLPNLEVPVVQ